MRVTKTLILALAGALVASPMFVPTANAQLQAVCAGTVGFGSIQIKEMQVPSQPIAPITGQQPLNGKLEYTYSAGGSVTPIAITVSVSSSAGYATATVIPNNFQQVVDPPGADSQTGNSYEQLFTVVVQFSRDAPAFQTTEFTVTADAGPGTCIQDAPPAEPTKFTAKPGFYGKLSAILDRSILKAGQNAQVAFPINIENFGNGQIKVFFEVEGGSKSSRGLQVVQPQPVIVDSPFQGGKSTKQVVKLDVNTPFKNGYMNAAKTIGLDITSRSTDDPTLEGDRANLNMLVRTQGVYVPGFESVFMLAGLVGALILVRARRRGA